MFTAGPVKGWGRPANCKTIVAANNSLVLVMEKVRTSLAACCGSLLYKLIGWLTVDDVMGEG